MDYETIDQGTLYGDTNTRIHTFNYASTSDGNHDINIYLDYLGSDSNMLNNSIVIPVIVMDPLPEGDDGDEGDASGIIAMIVIMMIIGFCLLGGIGKYIGTDNEIFKTITFIMLLVIVMSIIMYLFGIIG
jgi:hypothetical protein